VPMAMASAHHAAASTRKGRLAPGSDRWRAMAETARGPP
jgi:hypothetical protein